MVIEVRAYERRFCPRCPFQGNRDNLSHHARLQHGISLVGVPTNLAMSGWDITLRAGGRFSVIDLVDPKVADVGLHEV